MTAWSSMAVVVRELEAMDAKIEPLERARLDRLGAFIRDEMDEAELSIADPDHLRAIMVALLCSSRILSALPDGRSLAANRDLLLALLPSVPPEVRS